MLYWYVGQREGYNEVTRAMKWLEVCKLLIDPLPPSTGSSTKLRETYERFLLDFELANAYPADVFGEVDPALVQRLPPTEVYLTPTQQRKLAASVKNEGDGGDGEGASDSPALAVRKRPRVKSDEGSATPVPKVPKKSKSPYTCTACGRNSFTEGDVIVPCPSCHRGFHQSCHAPVIDAATAPPSWRCADCVAIK